MKDLQPTIAAVTRMLENEGLSIIPVMDKGTRVKMPPEKWNWKKYQSQQITMQELWGVMEKYDTSAIAIVCGAISGNLEVIDIDVKNWPGIDAILFKDIELLFPHIWQRLRIHKTPSGGYHILYKVIGKDVPGNKKLAAWENAPKNERGKPMYSLETRANGGYVVAPPSLNYSVYKNNEIPVISWEDRCSLIAICESYDAARQPEPIKNTTSQFKDDYYDENPFDHFNKSEAGSTIITEFGWTKVKESNRFIWFTRPGGTKGHVHASYNKDRNVYWVFTSNESLDEKGYNPSTILAHYKFNNDKKQCFRYLVEQGYGRIKPEREAALLARGKELPKNASQTAIQQRLEQEQQAQQVYPYGIFWSFDDKDKCIIDREGIYQVAEGLGFRIYESELYRIEQPFVKKQTQRQFFDTIKAYIKEEDGNIYKEICNSYEAFLQKSGEFTSTRIRELETDQILCDTEKECFKFYQNGILYITAEAVSFLPYGSQLIWHHKVLQRDFVKQDIQEYKYKSFLDLAIGLDIYVKQCIGYLCHDYRGEDEGYIIVLTEKCADPNQGGGSGKNIFGNILNNVNSVCTIGGEQVQYNEKFLQTWNQERVFFIADVPKKFNFSFLKEISSGFGVLKKLYQNEKRITPDCMPKFLINTNFSVEITDGGLKRRIKWIEFTDLFTKCGGVKKHFGCMFPGGWTREDWIGADNLWAECIQLYLQCNGTINNPELSAGGWEKQFKQTYGGNTFQFITENIENWEYKKEIEITDFNRQYQTFCTENNIQQRFELTGQRMNDAIADFCQRRGVKFERNKQISVNGLKQRFKVFTAEDIPF